MVHYLLAFTVKKPFLNSASCENIFLGKIWLKLLRYIIYREFFLFGFDFTEIFEHKVVFAVCKNFLVYQHFILKFFLSVYVDVFRLPSNHLPPSRPSRPTIQWPFLSRSLLAPCWHPPDMSDLAHAAPRISPLTEKQLMSLSVLC